MDRVLYIVSKLFNRIFVTNAVSSRSIFAQFVYFLRAYPLLNITVCIMIIGFGIGVIKRIIHS